VKELHFARNRVASNFVAASSSFPRLTTEIGFATTFCLAPEAVHSCSYLLNGVQYPSVHEHSVYDPSLTLDSQINVLFLICELVCFLTSSFLANQLPAPLLADLQSCLSISDVLPFDQQLILKNLLYKFAVNVVRVTFMFIRRMVPNFYALFMQL
jgi:hypothetical protein